MKNKLSFAERMGYGLTNFGSGVWLSFINTFLLFFYTNVAHLRPVVASTIISLAVVWDAVNDPLFASFADNHHFKNGEKMRPLLWTSIPLAICLVLMFVVYGDGSGNSVLPIVLAFVTYFAFRIPSTLHTLAINGMKQLASSDDKDRASLSTWASGGGAFGMAVSSIIFWPIVRGVAGLDQSGEMINPKLGFIVAAAIAGLMVIVTSMFNFFTSKERVFDDVKEKIPFTKCCKILLSNREFNLNLAILFLYGLYSTIISGYALYYCTYVINKAGLASVVMASYVVGIIAMLPVVNKLYKKYGRKKVIAIGTAILTAGSVIFLIFAKYTFAPFILCGSIGVGTELVTVMLSLNRADITDMVSESQGARMDGMVNNVMYFVQKLGNALLTFLLGLALEYSAFDGNLSVQPQSAVITIVLIMGVTSVVASVGIWAFSRLLKIDDGTGGQTSCTRAYINGIILDGTLDMTPQSGKIILVEGKTIKAIADEGSVDLSGAEIIDLKGKYILPGLINLHAHLPGSGKPSKKQMNLERICKILTSCELGNRIGCGMVEKNAKNALMAGITTIRSVGGIGDHDSRVRDAINSGKKIGPRLITSNRAISVPGGHMAGTFAYIANSPEEAIKLVEKIATEKPDLIKLMITGGVMDSDELGEPGVLRMPEEYIKAACDKAHELGFKVAAHCEGKEGVRAALKNGVDTIEHGAKPDDEIISLFKETGTCQVLTLSPAVPYAMELQGMFNVTKLAVKNSNIVMEGMIELAKTNMQEGITVGLGTDSACTYVTQYGFWRELAYFVKYCGVSNSYAIHTGTLVNAGIAGIADITGSIEEGKMADMIVVEGNPLENLSVLDDVKMVIFEGTLYDNPKVKKIDAVESVLK